MAGPDTRNIKINVTVDSDTRGSEQAAKSLEGVDKSAGKAEKGLAGLKKESESLDVQLAKTRTKVKDLENELIRTGDRATGRGSLRGRLNQERSWLRELEKLAKSAATKIPEDLALNIPKLDFSSMVSESRGGLIAGIVGIGLAAAPALGAIIAGAVAGTTVGGGIAGGVIAAAADQRVRLAFKDLVGEFTSEAFGGGAFVGPVVEGIQILKDTFRSLNLDETLAKAASSVPILAQGIGDLVSNIMPGFNKVLDQAETFTHVFADGLSGVGWAISDFLGSLMATEGTIEGLHAGFVLLEGTITGTGNLLELLGNIFHGTVVVGARVTGFLEDFVRGLENVAAATTRVLSFNIIGGLIPFGKDLHEGSNLFAEWNDTLEGTERVGWGAAQATAAVGGVIRETKDPTDEAAQALKKFNDEFERGIDLQAAYITDQLDVEEGLQNLADLFEENGTDLSQFTEEGQKNIRALVALAKEMRQVRDDQIALGGSVADANAVLAANKERLLEQAEAAGISREAIEALIGALFAVPNVTASFNLTRPLDESGEVKGKRAGGGPVSMGGAYLVGEGGPELFVPNSNGYVVPNGGGGGMGWDGGGVLQIEVGGSPSGPLESLFMQWLGNALAKYVSTVGLGNGGIIGVRTVSG